MPTPYPRAPDKDEDTRKREWAQQEQAGEASREEAKRKDWHERMKRQGQNYTEFEDI